MECKETRLGLEHQLGCAKINGNIWQGGFRLGSKKTDFIKACLPALFCSFGILLFLADVLGRPRACRGAGQGRSRYPAATGRAIRGPARRQYVQRGGVPRALGPLRPVRPPCSGAASGRGVTGGRTRAIVCVFRAGPRAGPGTIEARSAYAAAPRLTFRITYPSAFPPRPPRAGGRARRGPASCTRA